MPTPTIAMTPIASSAVSSYGYDASTKTLAVEFKNGRTFHYEGIDADAAAGLATAKSAGRYVNELLRGRPAQPQETPGQAHERRVRAERPVRTRGGR
jgi:hypothetical protein